MLVTRQLFLTRPFRRFLPTWDGLKRSGLVAERNEGRWVQYFLRSDDHGPQDALPGLWLPLRRNPQAAMDPALCSKLRTTELLPPGSADLNLHQVGLHRGL